MKGLLGKLNPMKAVNKVLGRKKGEEAKEAFFNNWWNPARVAVIQAKAMEKYWKKKMKKEEKKNKKAGLSSGGEATQGQVLGAIVKAVNKIANAVSFFFSGPGLGIALAIGLVPPILILCAALIVVAYLICTTLETLLTPIINLVCDLIHWLMDELGEPIKTILNAISGFISMLIDKITSVYEIIFDLYIGILKPIQQVIVDVAETIGMISGFIKKIVGNLFGTALNVATKAIGAVGSAIGSLFSSDDEKKEEEDPEKVFINMGKSITELKDYFKSGALADAITEGLKNLENFASNLSSLADPIGEAFNKSLENFGANLNTLLVPFVDAIGEKFKDTLNSVISNANSLLEPALKPVIDKLWDININNERKLTELNLLIREKFAELFTVLNRLEKIMSISAIASTIGNVFKSASGIFNSIKTNLKTAMGKPLTEEEKRKQEEQVNPFSVLIEGFERRHKESITILGEIKTSLLNIEKTKIQIGSMLDATNSGEVADGKSANSIQSVTISNETNVTGILEKIDETNKLLEGILTNTSLNDEGIEKTGAAWSI